MPVQFHLAAAEFTLDGYLVHWEERVLVDLLLLRFGGDIKAQNWGWFLFFEFKSLLLDS
jgi:hypothetical protein